MDGRKPESGSSIPDDMKRGGARKEVAERDPLLPAFVCLRCGRKAVTHLFITGNTRVSACGTTGCSWLTCPHCGATWDTEHERTMRVTWDHKLAAEADEAVTF